MPVNFYRSTALSAACNTVASIAAVPQLTRASSSGEITSDDIVPCCSVQIHFATDVEEEDEHLAVHTVCVAIARAVVLERRLPLWAVNQLELLFHGVVNVRLALPQGLQKVLRCVPVLEGRRCQNDGAAHPEFVGEGSAALCAVQGMQALAWRRGREEGRVFADWQQLLAITPTLASIFTLPLCGDGEARALGSVTCSFWRDPSAEELEVLGRFVGVLGRHITHQAKDAWEVSWGYLCRSMPPPLLERLLCPLATAGKGSTPVVPFPTADASSNPGLREGPPALITAASSMLKNRKRGSGAVQRALCSRCNGACSPSCLSPALSKTDQKQQAGEGTCLADAQALLQGSPVACAAAGDTARAACSVDTASTAPEGGVKADAVEGKACWEAAYSAGVTSIKEWCEGRSEADAAGTGFADGKSGARIGEGPLAQKWTLEFADPQLERKFANGYTSLLQRADVSAFQGGAPLLAVVLVASWFRRAPLLMGAAALGILLPLIVPAYAASFHRGWYTRHRAALISILQLFAVVWAVGQSYWLPGAESDSLGRALLRDGVVLMALSTLRHRLLFGQQLLVTLVATYLLTASTCCRPAGFGAAAAPAYLPGVAWGMFCRLALELCSGAGCLALVYKGEAQARQAFVERAGAQQTKHVEHNLAGWTVSRSSK